MGLLSSGVPDTPAARVATPVPTRGSGGGGGVSGMGGSRGSGSGGGGSGCGVGNGGGEGSGVGGSGSGGSGSKRVSLPGGAGGACLLGPLAGHGGCIFFGDSLLSCWYINVDSYGVCRADLATPCWAESSVSPVSDLPFCWVR
ncbi:loricrin-like [Salvia splendens]|uniref:loricrin-like n=1 Tax=Salvia splendens TaxID=180675 RepID=UPI001C2613CF|nr:loricrin-like [Salvia splendens]